MSGVEQPSWGWEAPPPQEVGSPCGSDLDCGQPASVVQVRHDPLHRSVLYGTCARTSGCPQHLLDDSLAKANAEDVNLAQAAAALGLPKICSLTLSGLRVWKLLQGLHAAATEYTTGDCPDCHRVRATSSGSQATCENHLEEFGKAAEWLEVAEQISAQTGVTYL